MSQEELAFAADLHRTAIGQLERGVVAPQLRTAVKISVALGVSVDQLLAGITWTPPILSEGGFTFPEHDPPK